MRETRTSGSMSGEEKRSDGPLGERGHERRRAQLAPPVLYAAALLLDSTTKGGVIRVALRSIIVPAAFFAGGLIQTAVGRSAGCGGPFTKRSGCTA